MPLNSFIPALLLTALLTACAAPVLTATVTPGDLPGPTATTTPVPTGTPTILPTTTASLTLSPTSTLEPSPTFTPSASLTPVPASANTAGIDPTMAVFQSCPTGTNVAGLGTARLLVVNQTAAKEISVTLKGTTLKRSQAANYSSTIARSSVIEILWGSYSVLVQIPGQPNMTIAFVQRGKDKTTLFVQLNKLVILGP